MDYFIRYMAVLLDAGPAIKEQIIENYNFLMELYAEMTADAAETRAIGCVTPAQFAEKFPQVASLCEKATPVRTEASTREIFGFLKRMIEDFDIEKLLKAIEMIKQLAAYFDVDLDTEE